MTNILKKCAKKMLFFPLVRNIIEKRIVPLYAKPDVEDVRLDLKQAFIEARVKASQNEGQLDLEEAFIGEDVKALDKLINMAAKENVTALEVGSWKGMSTSVLAKTVARYKGGQVFAVDHWRGGKKEDWNYEIAQAYDIYTIFKKNMILLGVWDIVHPMVMESRTASQIFADEILDFIFLDGDHRYDGIKNDILSWLPKLKNGGILCGHDCEGYYSKYSKKIRETIDEHLGDDYITGICHPGVVKALYECFQDKYQIVPRSVVWYYVKGDIAPR